MSSGRYNPIYDTPYTGVVASSQDSCPPYNGATYHDNGFQLAALTDSQSLHSTPLPFSYNTAYPPAERLRNQGDFSYVGSDTSSLPSLSQLEVDCHPLRSNKRTHADYNDDGSVAGHPTADAERPLRPLRPLPSRVSRPPPRSYAIHDYLDKLAAEHELEADQKQDISDLRDVCSSLLLLFQSYSLFNRR